MIVDSYQHQGMRKALVKTLAQKGIKDKRVLEAIQYIPRHIFFDPAFLNHAYQDKAFPIGDGQTISQPYTVAVQSSLLDIQPGEKVLEVGTGSGYQCAILAHMGAKVFSIERHKNLYLRAQKTLESLNIKAKLFCGDGSKGLPSFAPFDKIIVTAGAPTIPEELIQQTNTGGKIIIPVGDENGQNMIMLVKKSDHQIEKFDFGKFSFVPLVRQNGWNK